MTNLYQIFTQIVPFLEFVGMIIVYIIILILAIAYLTYAERKVIAAIQLRVGPNVVGPFGLLQPIADAVKLLHKEIIIPRVSNKFLFILAPLMTFSISLSMWAVIPWGAKAVISNLNIGLLYIYALSSLGVYGIIIAGWSGNSKYAVLGALRAVAQMISYEVLIGLIFIAVLLWSGSLNLNHIIEAQRNMWFVIPLFPMACVYIIAMLAETNRTPFDLPEAESELVAGYHVEYSSMTFGLLFLSEYANMILMSALGSILFLGGWLAPFGLECIPSGFWLAGKIAFFLFLFIWIRATFPRYRFDQLMKLSWTFFLPFCLIWIVLMAGIMLYFDLFPKVL